jgi:hypothetical protein
MWRVKERTKWKWRADERGEGREKERSVSSDGKRKF